jgi:OmcA/MtrC family decaheme c-type cytochrome
MRQFNVLFRWGWTFLVVVTLGLAGCDGDDGAAGAAGAAGQPGDDGDPGLACWDLNGNGVGDPEEDLNGDGMFNALDCAADADPVAAAVESAKAESCTTCHDNVGAEKHQSVYDDYVDPSKLVLTLNSVTSVPDGAGAFNVTLDFDITKDGQPFVDAARLPSFDQKRFYAVQYNSTTGEYLNGNTRLNEANVVPGPTAGNYLLTQTGVPFAPETPLAPFDGAQVYGYIAQTPLVFRELATGAERITGATYVTLYDDVANDALVFGTAAAADANSYVSAANVAGCENCHGVPYLKHGYRAAEIDVLPDFAACKSCHYDDRSGGHEEWQYMVDRPLDWAEGVALNAGEYAYTANIMNDTHMSHAMEFPYPQSMSNCSTCHGPQYDDAGVLIPGSDKLAQVLDNSNFQAETCVSCHAISGVDTWPKTYRPDGTEILDGRGNPVGETYAQPNRAPPFEFLWTHNTSQNYVALHQQVLASANPDCTTCHEASGFAPPLSAYHTGYDSSIYDANGVKYADQYTVKIDLITWDAVAGTLKIDYSASDPAIEPEVLVSLYGWDSKNFIIPSHARDGNRDRLEFELGDNNPLFSDFAEIMPGQWTVTANLAAFVPAETKDIPTLISEGVIKKAEISLTPTLSLAGKDVVLKAVDQTIDLTDGLVVPDYFKGANAVVSITKCNACHDALASSFHDGSGRGGDGIEVCKNCHNPTFTGGHIEMASRSIDNYVHAIHTFQDFDVDETFNDEDADGNPIPGFDPVLAKRYDQHTKHVFPNFTIRNCEACHLTPEEADGAVVYNVPDQSKSMPGVASSSSDVLTWYSIASGLAVENTAGRNIGTVPELVMGPASRACGGCHRARLVRDDAPSDLASFNEHVKAGGTLEENDGDDEILFGIIEKIMGMFQ